MYCDGCNNYTHVYKLFIGSFGVKERLCNKCFDKRLNNYYEDIKPKILPLTKENKHEYRRICKELEKEYPSKDE